MRELEPRKSETEEQETLFRLLKKNYPEEVAIDLFQKLMAKEAEEGE